jgi:hypothetical protein
MEEAVREVFRNSRLFIGRSLFYGLGGEAAILLAATNTANQAKKKPSNFGTPYANICTMDIV